MTRTPKRTNNQAHADMPPGLHPGNVIPLWECSGVGSAEVEVGKGNMCSCACACAFPSATKTLLPILALSSGSNRAAGGQNFFGPDKRAHEEFLSSIPLGRNTKVLYMPKEVTPTRRLNRHTRP